MANGNFISFDIQGLQALRESINPDRISKEVAVGIGKAAITLQSELSSAISRRYAISPSQFRAALPYKGVSQQQVGKNIINYSFALQDKPINLVKYISDITWGNIPPEPKLHKGKVHSVIIRKGQQKIVYGKYKQGGFTIKGGTVMVERTSPGRNAPLRVMYGPNIVDMANWVLENDTKVQQTFFNLSDVVMGNITL